MHGAHPEKIIIVRPTYFNWFYPSEKSFIKDSLFSMLSDPWKPRTVECLQIFLVLLNPCGSTRNWDERWYRSTFDLHHNHQTSKLRLQCFRDQTVGQIKTNRHIYTNIHAHAHGALSRLQNQAGDIPLDSKHLVCVTCFFRRAYWYLPWRRVRLLIIVVEVTAEQKYN